MLAAFITVIVLGVCGMGTVIVLSVRLNQGADGSSHPTFAPPWITSDPTPPIVFTPPASGTPLTIPDATPPYEEFRNALDWRGPVSALLAFCAILLGAATFFSRRVTRPLTRLTRAARTMAGGDLNVRVESSAVREIDDLAGAFNTMATSLSDADRQRRQMTADVAHELRTPLAIIRGRLEGMQDGIYSPSPEQITTLLNETALLERLIEDLRLLALVDTGQLPLHKESISPTFLLESVGRSFAEQARSLGVELRVADLPALPEVEADPQRISQVLGNLIANSLRHTPAGGTVLLNASRGVDAVYVSVSDTGSGIAPEDLPHIFDRFYRADAARTRTGGGAGLGLAIARRLIEAHHGTIRAESAPGQGTVITFFLPLS
jgi:two-component system OmpR family sensor kinase/two-component system sensor histidine kinase BaeS